MRGFVSIACVCILQSVSRVAHANDCVEDQSERNLTLRWHLCVRGFVSIERVCILQSVSRVAHVNDCVEDRSERRMT